MRRLGLVPTFAVTSLVPIALLGAVLGGSVRSESRSRNLAAARETAVLASRLGIQSQLTAEQLARGLEPDELARLDRSLRVGVLGTSIVRIKIWNRTDHVVYSDDRSLIGRRFPAGDELEEALDGEVASEVSNLQKAENGAERAHGRLLEVYVPIVFAGDPRPAGAFEIYLPYRPIADAIARDVRHLYLLLLAGLTLLWAVLFRLVHRASSRLRQQAADNRHQALHDALTGLPNRTLFRDRVTQAVLAAGRNGRHAAVMVLDLDRFKEVNDTLGHASGDLLLQAVGPRLGLRLRASDTVARLGGDEFAVLLPDVAGPATAIAVGHKVLAALQEPFLVDGLAMEVEASLGIAVFPDDGEDAETLLRRADMAMYAAKETHAGVESYAAEHDQSSRERLTLVGELRRAIDQSELVLHYQPKAELRGGAVCGVEALLRWDHPDRGLLLPDEFIPLAEHTGLIRPLTFYVLESAARQCRAWRDGGLLVSVAVNLSARNLHDVDLPEEVAGLLQRWQLPASALELEVTESTIMADPDRALDVARRLHDVGVRLVIDDFGTGYSSLAYLKQLPVGEIKIDKSFVLDMTSDENDAVIVRSTIDLAHNLGLRVVAEGVETAETWSRLADLGCDRAQGYLLSRPVPPAELTPWLQERLPGHNSPMADPMADKDERVASRARHPLPEEEAVGTDDALAQAEAILEDSDTRSDDRSAAPGTVLENRTSDDVTEPIE